LKRSTSSLNIDSVDSAYYWLEYKEFTASIALNYYRRSPKRIVEISFEDETLILDLISNKIYRNEELVHHETNYSMQDTYVDQMKYFVNCIDKGEEPMNNLQEAVKTLEIALS